MTTPESQNQGEAARQKIPYQHQNFVDFIAVLGRLFYDDPSIVLLDLLASEQRALTESDLKERLGWRESLIQQKLYAFEKHMIAVQDTNPSKGGNASRSNVYWRLNDNIYGAIRHRYQELLNHLNRLITSSVSQHEFECSNPSCEQRYTTLQAASCPRSIADQHPLCEICESPLKCSEFEATKAQAKKKVSRAREQLDPLYQKLLSISEMEIPVFQPKPKSSGKEPNPEERKVDENESTSHANKRPRRQEDNTKSEEDRSIPWFENTIKKPESSFRSLSNRPSIFGQKQQINFALKKVQ